MIEETKKNNKEVEEVTEKVENINIQDMIEETKKMLKEVRYEQVKIKKLIKKN